MNEKKRYYWLELQEDFFDKDVINFIESQQNGEKYIVFYLKLCLKSLKKQGILIRHVGNCLIPYDDAGLAKLTNTDVATVTYAMNLLSKAGLIKKLETGELLLTHIKFDNSASHNKEGE